MSDFPHKGSLLPISNRVLAADGHTSFLAHYDLNENDVLHGIKPIGDRYAALWDSAGFYPTGTHLNLGGQPNVTMTAWVYPTALPTNDRGCIMIGSGTYYLTVDTSYKISTYCYGKNPAGYHTSNGTCPLNTWTHIAAVWDETTVKIYINGNLDRTINATGNITGSNAMFIGSEDGSRFFRGRVNDLGLWSTAKSQEEVRSIMYRGIDNNENGLRGFWKFNEGTGEIIRDSSPLGCDLISSPNRSFSWADGNSIFTLRPQEGYFGGGIVIEEGTTNILLVSRQKFEGWIQYLQAEVIVTQNIEVPEWKTDKATRIQTSGGTNTLKYYTSVRSPSVLGQAYTAQVKIKNIGTNAVTFRTQIGNSETIQPGEIKTAICSGTGNGSTNLQFRFQSGVVENDLDFIVYQPQVEEKPFVTSFVDGNRPDGKLRYLNPIKGNSTFTISFWAKNIGGGTPSYASLLSIAGGSNIETNTLDLDGGENNNEIRLFTYGSSGATTIVNTNVSFVNMDWTHIAIVRDQLKLKLYINGNLEGETTNSGEFSLGDTVSLCQRIGARSSYNGRYSNLIVDELRIDSTAKTEREIAAWYYSNSPFWPRGIYRKSY